MENPHLDDKVSEVHAAVSLKCPECCSERLYRAGLRYLEDGNMVQRWLCRHCGFRFSQPNEKKPLRKKPYGYINNACPSTSSRQICALDKRVRNLIPTEIKAVAGEETQTQEEIKGKIIQFIWQMQKDNYSKATITTYGSALERLVQRGCNLLEPEAVKETLAKMRGSEAYKYIIAAAYSLFLKEQGLTWKPPICHVNRPLPFIPTERELDDLIAGCGRKTAAFLQCLKETGMRMGECSRLT